MALTDSGLQKRLDEVYAGPKGPHIGAFFDFDGTIIHGFSAVDFYIDRIRRGKVGPVEGVQTLAMALRGITTEDDFDKFVGVGLKTLKGVPEAEVLASGDKVFRGSVAPRVFPEAWQLIEAHQRMGHTVAIASSATHVQIQPAAEVLGIKHVLSTPLEVDDAGMLTGTTGGKTLWRAGKARAVREFVAEQGIDLDESYGYANGDEDIPFLELVGHPCALTSEPKLRAHALQHGWPVLDFRSRGVPGLSDIVRSGAAIGGLTTGMVTGAAFGLLNRSRKQAVDTMSTLSAEFALGLAGIQVEAQGEEHLWSHRPAVFIFNHQSQLDVAVTSYLLRHGFTGVAKKELKTDPIVGIPFRFAGVAFVDRKGGKDPRKALAPAVKKLHEGTSIVIAPEGTRSLTPTLGPFKTGAFHLAREAGVPVVPIIIRNAGELMWRDSYTLKPGTIQVVIKEPIDVSAWEPDEVRERVAEVREMFANTLARWPQGEATLDGVGTVAHSPAEVDVANLQGELVEPEPLVADPGASGSAGAGAGAAAGGAAAAGTSAPAKAAPRRRTSAPRTARVPAAQKTAASKAPAAAAKKSTAKKPAKRTTAKTTARKAPATSTAKKSTTKKASATPTPATSAPAKSTAAKGTQKAPAKTTSKSTAQKSTARKSTTKKASATSTPARTTTTKSTAKKTATKKRSAKKPDSGLSIAPRTATSGANRSRTRGSIVDIVSPDA